MVQIGDELTYTIDWINNAVDENGVPSKADITITDKIPAGTTFVSADNNGVYNEDAKTLTWTFKDAKAGESGTVSFKVIVDESAAGRGCKQQRVH